MALANPGARAYQTQSILTASPGQLVLLMYDGALRFMAQARAGFAMPEEHPRRIETIHTALLRAQAILSELRANLDMEAGGDVAANLDRLYDYHIRRLFECNLRKDEAPLIEVEGLVRTLRDAWAEMLRTNENRVA
jgi:flagellar secretion chaperone FliS